MAERSRGTMDVFTMVRTAFPLRYCWTFGAVLLALLLASARTVPAAQSSDWPACDIRTTERVVAVGDVHGAYDGFVDTLRAAEVVDARARWAGGRAILVQTGDVLDRGSDSRKILDLLRRLEREAIDDGGRVYVLLGNHELMRLVLDWRYVSAEEFAAFRTFNSSALRERAYTNVSEEVARLAREEDRPHNRAEFRERFMAAVPLGYIEMRQAFAATGDYGEWLREHYAVIKINGIVFVHGGMTAATAALGCEGINDAVRRDVTVPDPTAEQLRAILSPDGPLWYRGLAREPDPEFAPAVTNILGALGARAIVVGHTPSSSLRIETRFGSRVIQIDTGMLGGRSFPGGVGSALEITGDTLTAIYENGSEQLPGLVGQ